jgi:hypothetical protein
VAGENLFARIDGLLSHCPPGEVGPPLEWPLKDLAQVYRVAWLCTDSADPAVAVTLPQGARPEIDWQDLADSVAWEGDRVLLGYGETPDKWRGMRRMEDLGACLGSLPDGSILELLTGCEENVGRQRYQGQVQGGIWHIHKVYPAMPRRRLAEALAFSRALDEQDFLEAPDEASARQIQDAIEGERALLGVEVDRQGARLQVRVKGDRDRGALMMAGSVAFRRLFGDVWDFSQVEEDVSETLEAFAQFSQAIARRVQGALPAAPGFEEGKEITRLRGAVYRQARLTSLDFVLPADVEMLDREMEALGLRPLGDLRTDKVPYAIMRGYAAPGASAYGAALANTQGEFVVEFHSEVADGGSVTTSSRPGLKADKKKKCYRASHPTAEVAELWRLHQEALARHGGGAPVQGTLEDLCQALDRSLQRQGM